MKCFYKFCMRKDKKKKTNSLTTFYIFHKSDIKIFLK